MTAPLPLLSQGVSPLPTQALNNPQALAPTGQMPAMPPQAEQLLNQLNDVISPGAISIWPLAPGWWVLMVWAVVGVIGLCLWVVRRQAANRYRKAAISELVNLKFESTPQFVATMSSLLKRVVISSAPESRTVIGNLHGQAWVDFLNGCCSKPALEGDSALALARQQYSSAISADVSQLKSQILQWVTQHKLELIQIELRKIQRGQIPQDSGSISAPRFSEASNNV